MPVCAANHPVIVLLTLAIFHNSWSAKEETFSEQFIDVTFFS
jgi:hypothetical protein